jgi:hypothetical protein
VCGRNGKWMLVLWKKVGKNCRIAGVVDHETAPMCSSLKQASELQSVIIVPDPFACM